MTPLTKDEREAYERLEFMCPEAAGDAQVLTKALLAERALLSNLLAVIHRNGGHYQSEHGTEQAVADALAQLATERDVHEATRAKLARVREACLASHQDLYGGDECIMCGAIADALKESE